MAQGVGAVPVCGSFVAPLALHTFSPDHCCRAIPMGKPTTSKSSRAESGGEAGWLKRRFCMYQLQGICRKSTQECPWAHSIEEMEQSRSRGKKKASPAREESGYSSSEWTSSHGAGRSSESSSSPTPLREVVQDDGFRNSHDINKPKVMPYQASSCPREPPLSTVGAGLAGVPGVGWPGPPPGLEDRCGRGLRLRLPGLAARAIATASHNAGARDGTDVPLGTPIHAAGSDECLGQTQGEQPP
ncbi:unnamed protein product [Prorocentrum cordatum]|uniref:C3H1-type domain-containing protein n=1 Tax=Prorocentrum cordatum TaxID=2364126 RepID=A0ABN9TUI6_9DINO|nr:unnamed protein product [Polarella glacialis]